MLRKILIAIVVIPLVVILVGFAVANRQTVTLSFDPFSSTQPAYSTTLPLFVLIFLIAILGVIVGGIATWFGQYKWRRTARRLDAEVRQLHEEMDAVRRRFAASEAAPPPADPAPPLVIPPPPG